jgi:hypothetical protein
VFAGRVSQENSQFVGWKPCPRFATGHPSERETVMGIDANDQARMSADVDLTAIPPTGFTGNGVRCGPRRRRTGGPGRRERGRHASPTPTHQRAIVLVRRRIDEAVLRAAVRVVILLSPTPGGRLQTPRPLEY